MIHSLEADSIELNFGLRKILSNIYIKCETGKITGLLGRNGQGKSCLMNTLLGNLKPVNSAVRLDGRTINNPGKRPDVIRYLPQFNFIPNGLPVAQVLDDFGLQRIDFEQQFPAFKNRSHLKVSELSGGQWRTLEIYIIVKSPSLFAMLDEPFTHLNPIQADVIKDFLLMEKLNKGLLITDHMYKHVLDISDNTYLLGDGCTKLIKDNTDLATLGYISLNSG